MKVESVYGDDDPRNQDDIYIWKAPYLKPSIAPFARVNGYRFRMQETDKKTFKRVTAAIKKDLPGKCDYNGISWWPIYQYNMGKDGKLLVVSCKSTSYDSWTVFYRLTPQNKVSIVRFHFPVLNNPRKEPNKKLKIIGYKPESMILNANILQRRIITGSSILDRKKYTFSGEWIWKEKFGFVLLKYSGWFLSKKKKWTEIKLIP